MDLFPIYRIEQFLDAIVSGTTPPEPVAPASVEFYLAKIAGADVQIPASPISRVDHFLAKICGQNVTLPIPQSREERYLAKIAGEDVEIPPFPINRIDFWLAEWASGSGGELVTVTGVSPLLLVNSLAHSIKSLTQYGKVEQRNLPSGYTQVEYIAADGSTGYVNTGIVINSVDTEVEVDYQFTEATGAASPSMAWGYMGNSSNLPRWGFGAYGGKWLGSVNQTGAEGSFDTGRHKAVMRVYMDGESPMWDGTLDGTELYAAASLPNLSLFTGNTLPVFLFARNNNGAAGNYAPAKIYSFKVTKAAVLVNNFVPCKRGTTPGFFDTVTGTFLAGVGTLTAGADSVPSPSASMDLWTNNGVLTKPHDTYTAVDGQGTYVTPGSAANRIYKALNVGDGNYTITVPAAFDFIVQYKTPAEGSIPTDYGNIGTWVNGTGTVTLDKGTAYGYGIALRDHNNQSGTISPSDFSGTIVVVHDDEPVKAVGTGETLTVRGINLLDPSTVTNRKYINASGQELPSYTTTGWLNHSDYIRVTAGEDYTLSVTGTDGGPNTIAFNWFDENKTILATRPTQSVSGTTAYTFTNTAPADAAYLIVNFITGTKVMVEESSTATDYQPYVAPQTVNDIPMLLSVGNYKDDAELISGIKTGAVGVLVIKGTEEWTKVTGHNAFYVVPEDMRYCNPTEPGLCTHFKGDGSATASMADNTVKLSYTSAGNGAIMIKCNAYTTADEFKAGAAAAFASGNPWIALYPRATETTEQGTAHALNSYAGTTVVTAETNVDPVELSAEYTAGAA